tara:strand:- start:406 stop:1005 length:600 start_codon:yes stop_codon:yes gene_type:complete
MDYLKAIRQRIIKEARATTETVIAHDHPSSAKAKEGAWSGGQNIHHETEWMKALDLEGPVSSDLKDILDHDSSKDVVHAVHNSWSGEEAGAQNLVRNLDWIKSLGITESMSLAEACGCEVARHDDPHMGDHGMMSGDMMGDESDMLSRSDAIGAVMAIADMTSCPKTREILSRALEEIIGMERMEMSHPLDVSMDGGGC